MLPFASSTSQKPRDLNSKIQAKFDDEATLEDILQSEKYDDKLVQQLGQRDRFINATF